MFEEALRNGVDVVVRGEGGLTTLELMNVIGKHGLDVKTLNGVQGIAYRDGDRVVVTPNRPLIQDLDMLPPTARYLLPMEMYAVFGKPIRVAQNTTLPPNRVIARCYNCWRWHWCHNHYYGYRVYEHP